MPLSILPWVNLILGISVAAIGIVSLTMKNFHIGIADIVIALFNLYLFLSAVA